ncbi:MafI family immunity protein [Undibacterium sp. MH2W]|uniref:MafI family immunity protein n=1 Tax=Undibacterium sp. MH2W TaxID=3413044 RepID=UPI003BF259D6
MSDFTIVESIFSRLLSALNGVFSVSEIAEVSGFVDVGEYGLALDTAVDIFVEEEKVASDDVIVLVQSLAIAMELPAVEYSDRLRAADGE